MQVNIEPAMNAASCSVEVKVPETMFCGGNEACNFDFASTRNQDAAKSTLYMSERMNQIRSFMKPGMNYNTNYTSICVVFCSILSKDINFFHLKEKQKNK